MAEIEARIEVSGVHKRFGSTVALDGMTFSVPPGQVTGFVGPNGAGKSTTMRVILGLDAPDAGTALVGGRPYRALHPPLCHVGSLLDASAGTRAGSAYAAVMATPGHGVQMQYDFTHGTAGLPGAVSVSSPRWLRLVRSGDTVTGYDSADGSHWAMIGSATLAGLGSSVQGGLFVAAAALLAGWLLLQLRDA
jgi:energy-coupling factor transporter ATP-binding protein EcfA2